MFVIFIEKKIQAKSFFFKRKHLASTANCFLFTSCFQESEKIIAELNETWEEKLRKTEAIRMER